VNALAIECRLLEVSGQLDQALKLIAETVRSKPDIALQLANEGLQMALRNDRIDEGYELLKSVGDDQLDAESLLTLGLLSGSMAINAKGAEKRKAEYDRWEARLQSIEGDEGCSWRLVRAQRCLAEASTKAVGSQVRKQLIDQAEREYQEIERQRPRWNRGLALGGMIAIEQNRPTQAIELLRRAVQEGDNSINTSQMLIRMLLASNQFEQAEAETRRLMSGRESAAPILNLQIETATVKGDYRWKLHRELSPQIQETWVFGW
jgi:Tetratricopeptide repeat